MRISDWSSDVCSSDLVRAWKMLGVASMLLYFAIATFSPFLWDGWLGNHQLFDASALPFALQLVTGFLVLELGVYLWHRTMHNSEPLWRAMHQMHHSAERVDIWGAFYFHPLDMVGWENGRAPCRGRGCSTG